MLLKCFSDAINSAANLVARYAVEKSPTNCIPRQEDGHARQVH